MRLPIWLTPLPRGHPSNDDDDLKASLSRVTITVILMTGTLSLDRLLPTACCLYQDLDVLGV